MCRETLDLMKKMDIHNIDTQLALQCAPLLSGLKISNLLCIEPSQLKSLCEILKGSGISYYVLYEGFRKESILLYDEGKLTGYLSIGRVRRALINFGYSEPYLNALLPELRKKYSAYMSDQATFPHELGLLLGYPVEDVMGFLKNLGDNSLYTGYWKIYENPQPKLKLFKLFEDAERNLLKKVFEGTSMRDIIAQYK